MQSHAPTDPPTGPPDPSPAASLLATVRLLRVQLEAACDQAAGSAAAGRGRPQPALWDLARDNLDGLQDCLARLWPQGAPADASGALTAQHPGAFGGADAEWDLADDRVVWSAEMFRIFGRDPGLGPLTLDQLPAHLHVEDRRRLSGLLTAALVDGKPIDAEFRISRPDGTQCSAHCAGEPVLEADGTVRSIWLAVRDVTDSPRARRFPQ